MDAPHTLDTAEILDQRRQLSRWSILWDQVRSAVVVLLVAAVVAGVAIGEIIEAAAVAVVLLVNTVVGYVTELRADRVRQDGHAHRERGACRPPTRTCGAHSW